MHTRIMREAPTHNARVHFIDCIISDYADVSHNVAHNVAYFVTQWQCVQIITILGNFLRPAPCTDIRDLPYPLTLVEPSRPKLV